ncbi:alpha-aminoadipic semialdehyde synthase, mitochondrial-like isoform X2 [Gordionus sp. m RMFG-2023]|uniref:alpha-aminoadipic semialdehyde synthase, mitochondrial-like isoform X2 n=1 Tax=Gordionus sp. m RMFG-2023 TaxID=3053472 RepID=UPI0031FC5D6F
MQTEVHRMPQEKKSRRNERKKGIKKERRERKKEYANAGAIIQEDIMDASLIIGVKRPSNIEELIPNKTYLFFSHTHKAQIDNMSLLDAIVEKNIKLIDYEKMVDTNGQRVIAFGKYAGVAGMINILHGLGLRFLALGHHTPFMNVGLAHNYRNSNVARQAIRDVGYQIALGLMPKSVGPLTFIFTGTGNVSQGAREVFNELPHEYVDAATLPKISKYGKLNKIYACVISREHHLLHKEKGVFDANDYDNHPDNFISSFSKTIAPYATVIVNGIYWAPNSPKLITIPAAKSLLQPCPSSSPSKATMGGGSTKKDSDSWAKSSPDVGDNAYFQGGCPPLPHKLLAICDISADPGGSIEFMSECTTIDKPFCLYDADQNKNTESYTGIGILVCSIDNMPTQIPIEATDFFGELLLPFIPDMLKLSTSKVPLEKIEISTVIKNAIIASDKKLTPNFAYIQELRNVQKQTFKSSGKKPKILILGAGYVCGPVVEYLSRENSYEITIVSPWQKELQRVVETTCGKDKVRASNLNPTVLDIDKQKHKLEDLIKESDIVVSLLPFTYHPSIANLCIKHKRNMVTTSYVSPDMRLLQDKIKEANICIVNECGLDPGIDHMLAMEIFDDIKEKRKQLIEFSSFCGGIPAPEFANNPLRYKFSWFPKGVLLNSLSGCKYLKDQKVVEIPPDGSIINSPWDYTELPAYNLESFPNRDSTVYVKEYDIPSVRTLIRGTLRYKGFCNVIKGFHQMGLFDQFTLPILHPSAPSLTWKSLMCNILGKPSDIMADTLENFVYEKVGDSKRVQAFEELGMLSDQVKVDKKVTLLDTVSNYLAQTLSYGKNEKDMIILRHNFVIYKEPNNPLEKELKTVTLIVYGEPNGHTAMAKTVGFPCGIAVKMILEGEIQGKGLILPLTREIYKPILDRLMKEGIAAKTETKMISTSSHTQKHIVG